jgi:hypothetical protein
VVAEPDAMMSEPTILLAVILASVYASAFHVIKGKTLTELPIFWASSLVGFAIGEAAARFLHLNWFRIGELHVVEGSIISIACLFIARWLKV